MCATVIAFAPGVYLEWQMLSEYTNNLTTHKVLENVIDLINASGLPTSIIAYL